MKDQLNQAASLEFPSRRQMISLTAIALGGFAAVAHAAGQSQAPSMKEAASRPENHARTFLHQEVQFKATPQRIYEVLLDSKQFAAFTGMPAEIDPKPGGALKIFGGLVVARNIELIPNQRIVQAGAPRVGIKAYIRSSASNSSLMSRELCSFWITPAFKKASMTV